MYNKNFITTNLETGVEYNGYITSVGIVNEDTPKEAVLINVTCELGTPDRPASYAMGTEQGHQMLCKLLKAYGYQGDLEISKIRETLVNKEVRFKTKPQEGYEDSTSIYPPKKEN